MTAADRQRPPLGELYLDHLGHFVPDLDAAAAVWEKVGLRATPISHHQVAGKPAGTSNRCVMLEEGYLELLAPTLDTPNAQRVRDRMKRFVGVHLACFGTPDAAAEQQRLAGHGFEPEPVVHLKRKIETGDTVEFRVVYVKPGRMTEGRVQYCEHVTPAQVWRPDYVNAGIGLAAVYVVADDPVETAARWGRFAGLLPRRAGDTVELGCTRGRVVIGTRKNIEKLLGSAPAAPALAGYALACADPDAFAARCSKAGLKVDARRVSLPPALGGTWLLESPA